MRETMVGLGVLMGALALGACSGDDSSNSGDGPGGSGASIPLEDVPEKVAALQCNALETCLGDFVDLFLGGMECERRVGTTFEDKVWPSFKAAIVDGRVVYHGDKFQACLDAFGALGCDMFSRRAPEICEEAFEGTVEVGGDCKDDLDCKGQAFCKVSDACPGECSNLQPSGATCSRDDECQNGLVCDGGSESCATPAKKDQDCGKGLPVCEFGLSCLGGDQNSTGTCKGFSDVFSVEAGATCDVTRGPLCKKGLACVITSATPTAEWQCKPTVASGAACSFGIPSPCPTGEYCDAKTEVGQIEGTCKPLPSDGEPCDQKPGFQPCAPDHNCDSKGVCRKLKRLDGSCSEHVECYSENCSGATCKPYDACLRN